MASGRVVFLNDDRISMSVEQDYRKFNTLEFESVFDDDFMLYLPRELISCNKAKGKVISSNKSDVKNFIPDPFNVFRLIKNHDYNKGLFSSNDKTMKDNLSLALKTDLFNVSDCVLFRELDKYCFSTEMTVFDIYRSGQRSSILRIEKDGQKKFYNVKGCARYHRARTKVFGDEPQGATVLRRSNFEKKGIEEYNKIMEANGIVPLQKYAGRIEYSGRWEGDKVVASIREVRGDTRLDEILRCFAMLNYFDKTQNSYFVDKSFRQEVADISNSAKILSYRMGVWAGLTYGLFSDAGFTWSRQYEDGDITGTNAHTGNFVLYEQAKNETIIGMTDLDAYLKPKNETLFEKIKKAEHDDIFHSLMSSDFPSCGLVFDRLSFFYQDISKISHRPAIVYDYCWHGFTEGLDMLALSNIFKVNAIQGVKPIKTQKILEVINFIQQKLPQHIDINALEEFKLNHITIDGADSL